MTRFADTTSAAALTAVLFSCSETLPPASAAIVDPAAASATVDAPPCGDGRAWQEALGALPASAVQHVQATYFRDTCAGTALVSGTRLAISPEAVASAQWARLLECPTAHVRFAASSGSRQSPALSWTPDGRVDIEVTRDGRNLALTIRAESAAKNSRLFQRTAAFVSATRMRE
jgi:hypothetical protein